jgi:hypothetical protein
MTGGVVPVPDRAKVLLEPLRRTARSAWGIRYPELTDRWKNGDPLLPRRTHFSRYHRPANGL